MTPTLVLMLKAPAPGAVKTRLAARIGAERAAKIYRVLVEHQVRALPAGWPVVVCFDPPAAEAEMRAWLTPLRSLPTDFRPQHAGDFGQRLIKATADTFLTGAEAVILIGGDCPYLTGKIFETASAGLMGSDVVIGPASDGGYYLIGLHTPAPALFTGITWSSSEVLEQTMARCANAGLRVHKLAELEDVDDEASWLRAVTAGVLP